MQGCYWLDLGTYSIELSFQLVSQQSFFNVYTSVISDISQISFATCCFILSRIIFIKLYQTISVKYEINYAE